MGRPLEGCRDGSQPGALEEVAGFGRRVGSSLQVACVDRDHSSLFHPPIPLRALPGCSPGPAFLVLSNEEKIN